MQYARAAAADTTVMKIRMIARTIAAIVVGYGVIVVITSVGFEMTHGGRSLWGSPPPILLAAAGVAVVAGLVGGYVAGLIGPFSGARDAAFVLLPLAGDTTYVLFFFRGPGGPMWFEAMGSATLMICTILGGVAQERLHRPQFSRQTS